MAKTAEQKARYKAWKEANRPELQRKRGLDLDGRYRDFKTRAARLGRKFRMAKKTYKKMILDGCYYCGKSLLSETGGSIDRVDNNNRGYTTQNSVACCKDCNYVKSKVLTADETLLAMEIVKKFREKDPVANLILEPVKKDRIAKRKKQLGKK